MKSFKVLLVAGLVISSPTNSLAGCDKPAPGYDTTYCLAKLFLESDNELNEAYKNLISKLKPHQKKILVGAQRSWIKFRNAECSDNGTISVDCNYAVNKQRTKFLLDRYTECKIGSCKDDLLGDEKFDEQ